jgi:tetratricopeptide (TPR) repeat protein
LTMSEKDLDFEISFYERLLEKKPDFIEALIVLGDSYSKKGWFEKGLEVDKKLVTLRPDDPVIHYNLACDYSLLKAPKLSFHSLEKALQLGYDDFEFMSEDPDLQFIREDKRFKELVGRYKDPADSV